MKSEFSWKAFAAISLGFSEKNSLSLTKRDWFKSFCKYLDFVERGVGLAATTICLFEKEELDANSFWEGLALVTCLKVWDLKHHWGAYSWWPV